MLFRSNMDTFTTNFCIIRTALSVGTEWCNFVAKGAHLNMLWICFVFVELDMRSGACVEPWEIHYHIWGIGFHNGNSDSLSTRTPHILPQRCPNDMKFCTELAYV